MRDFTNDESLDALIFDGSAVKTLDGKGKIGGYLVLFSTASDPDLARDYFTKDTDFNIDVNDKASVFYAHGLDPVIGKRKLGIADLKIDKAGVWAEAQLNIRDSYERKILELVQAGKLGWSSGTAPHLVEREAVKGAFYIKSWPILDASLTPQPCEPRTSAMQLKSIDDLMTFEDSYKEISGANEKRDLLRKAVQQHKGAHTEIVDHDDSNCYYMDYQAGQHYAVPYKIRGEKVTLGMHTPVRQFTGYKPMDGAHFDSGLGNEKGVDLTDTEIVFSEESPLTGLSLKEHIEQTLIAVDVLAKRLHDYADLRTSQQRSPIGTERLSQVKSLHDGIKSLIDAAEKTQVPAIDLEAIRAEIDATNTWLTEI